MKNIFFSFWILAAVACSKPKEARIPVIVDTDANNELDDQHALAYLFFNEETFDIRGVTVNATFNGGDIDQHYAEAKRVMQLCDVIDDYPLLKGADKDFENIAPQLGADGFDGQEAVDFIIEQANANRQGKLILVPIGKLTNIALALKRDPGIKDKVRIVWLGSNYPAPGEYNLVNDIPAMNYILEQEVEFEMVMVRYGEASGSDAVRVTPDDVKRELAGKGPQVNPVTGRHGGSFSNFGDYSVNLFSKIDLHGNPPSRALFDVVALAVLKNQNWGEKKTIPAPKMIDSLWQEIPDNKRQILIWENFDDQAILSDFIKVIENGS